MISNIISFSGIGNVGGTAVHRLLDDGLSGKVGKIFPGSHLPVHHIRNVLKVSGPVMGTVRNPFDWYIATWYTELQYHRWRGGFRDWLYNRKHIPGQFLRKEQSDGPGMWDTFLYFAEIKPGDGPTGYDYILQFERLKRDLILALEDIGIIPQMMTRKWIQDNFSRAILDNRRRWVEGTEQWMRDELYTPEMIDKVYEQDAPLFERFKYTFEQRYYYAGGCGQSCHGTRIGDWEGEKQLSESWVVWGPERPGPFVRP